MLKTKRSFLNLVLKAMILAGLLGVSCTSYAQMTPTAQPYKVNLPTVVVSGSPSIFGIVVNSINSNGGLDQAVAANASWVRSLINWKDVQATEGGAYNWSSPGIVDFESQLKNAATNHINVDLQVGGTPDWAKDPSLIGLPNCDGRILPSKYSEWSSFVQAVVTRYSVPPYNLSYIELFNEPDAWPVQGCWGQPNDTSYYGGAAYGEMMKVVYPAVKAKDPGIEVLVGGLLMDCDPRNPPPGKGVCLPTKFIEGILSDGAGPYFDGISFHGYDFYSGTIGLYSNPNWSSNNSTGPVVLSKASYLTYALNKYHVTNKFLISTESSIVCKQSYCNDPGYPQRLPDYEASKAYYVAQVYASSIVDNFKANIWYSIFTDPTTGNMGLMNPDRSALPAYNSYQFTSSKLAGASFVQQISATGLKVYAFTKANGHTLWLIYSIDQNLHSISLPSMPSAINMIGTNGKPVSQTLSQSLTVGFPPVFVEWGN